MTRCTCKRCLTGPCGVKRKWHNGASWFSLPTLSFNNTLVLIVNARVLSSCIASTIKRSMCKDYNQSLLLWVKQIVNRWWNAFTIPALPPESRDVIVIRVLQQRRILTNLGHIIKVKLHEHYKQFAKICTFLILYSKHLYLQCWSHFA